MSVEIIPKKVINETTNKRNTHMNAKEITNAHDSECKKCKGWDLFNIGTDQHPKYQIQKCDACDRFDSDIEVIEQLSELLQVTSGDKYDRAIAALAAALEGYKDCMPYKGEFLADKHGDAEELEVLEAELEALRP